MKILTQVLDLLPDVVYQLDREGRITYVSGAVRAYGYAPEELLGVSLAAVVHPEDRVRCERQLNERRTGDRRTHALEVRLLTKEQRAVSFQVWSSALEDGKVLQLDAAGMYETSPEGERVWAGTIGVARDVTEERRHEQERQALNRIQDAVAAMRTPDDIGVVVGVVGVELRRIGIEFMRLGINVVEPGTGEPRVRTHHPSEDGRIGFASTYQTPFASALIHKVWREQRTVYRRNLEKNDPLEEWPVVREGVVVCHSIIDVPFSHGTLALSHPKANAFSDRQVTFLEQVALILTTSFTRLDDIVGLVNQRNQYQALFSGAGDAIFVLQDGRYIECNPRSLELLRCRRDDLIGARPADFAPSLQPGGRPSEEVAGEALAQALAGERRFLSFAHQRPDGTVLSTEVILCRVELARGPCVMATVRDVTDRVQARQALLRSSRLAAMGELAAGLAHELRQPLTVISTIAQGIQFSLEGEVPALSDEKLHGNLDRILTQVDRIDELIEHLRLFARDRRDEAAAPFDAAAAVRNTLLLIGRRLANHQIEVQVEIAENLPLAQGNPYRLEQAILSLLANALDALVSVADRPRVVRMTAGQDGAWVVIEVVDNGPGIPEEHRVRLFEPFFTTKPDAGAGLGLSVAQATLSEHGGRLEYASREGEGARFLVHLPAVV